MTERDECSTKHKEFAKTINKLISGSGKLQVQIARMMGYENANIITFFKKGLTRVPPDKVVALAFALDQDPGVLLRQWLVAYMPGMLQDIDTYLIPSANRRSEG